MTVKQRANIKIFSYFENARCLDHVSLLYQELKLPHWSALLKRKHI